jgi:tetratricopeptide (TPR) repeat protein
LGFFGKREKKIGGEIGFYGLTDWWLATFNEEERRYMEQTFQPMSVGNGGGHSSPLTTGQILNSSQSACAFLGTFAGWFNKPDDRYLAHRILDKAEQTPGNTLDRHFLYHQMVKTYYKDRDTVSGSLEKAVAACEKQISIAPEASAAFKKEPGFGKGLPAHTGYEQLAIIRDKQGDYAEAIRLSQQAKSQKWAGDWDKRIARYQKKLDTVK